MSTFPVNPTPIGRDYTQYSQGITDDGTAPVDGKNPAEKTSGKFTIESKSTSGPAPTSSTDDIPEPEVTEADQSVIDRLEISLTNSIDALFEIYTLLQLMQECANKQRAATREARQSEYEAEKAAIHRQADEIQTSAVVGLTMGILGSVISIGSLIGSGVKLGTGVKNKLELIKNSDVPEAAANLHDATNNVKALGDQLKDFKAGLPTKPPATPPPGQEAVPPPPPKPAPNAPGAQADAGKVADTNKPGKQPETPPDVLDDNIDQNAMTQDQKDKWKDLSGKYLKANNDLTDAQNNFDRALGELHNNPEYVQAESDLQTAQNLQTLGQTFAGLFTSLSQSLSQLIQANATLEQVAQKDAEQESEQQSDLFKNAGELRQAVLQLMSAVTQVEKDSLNKIINA